MQKTKYILFVLYLITHNNYNFTDKFVVYYEWFFYIIVKFYVFS